ncbi:MAG: transglycosylase SLT domain-containing protein [Burkholderiaceae bacterium]|jgi:membrane-bound lytic murein transglycosylase D
MTFPTPKAITPRTAALLISLLLTGCGTLQQTGTHQGEGQAGTSNASVDWQGNASVESRSVQPNPPSAAGQQMVPIEQTKGEPAVPATPPNLMLRVQRGFAMPELPSKLVDTHIKRFLNKPEYLERVFDRGGRYLHHIVEEVEARGLPTELALLPIVESAFNPQATSRAKAAGLWQFIPSTGRVFNLSQNWWTDERRDIIESTRAALDYLQKIYAQQGNDWFLALASYNWGEGAVSRAIKRNKARKKPTDYLSLKMPKETRHYVPQLIALRNLLRDPEKYGLRLPYVEDRPYFAVIDKNQSIDLALAAELAELEMNEFKALNPHLHRPVITVSQTSRIILPVENIQTYNDNLNKWLATGLPLVTWRPYTLKKGDTLDKLAKAAGISPMELAKANGLKSPKTGLLPGSSILAPVAIQSHDPGIETTLARFSGAKTIERVHLPAKIYRVRKSDTLTKIARRFGVSTAQIRKLNKLSGDIKTGMRLIIRPSERRVLVTDAQGRRSYR